MHIIEAQLPKNDHMSSFEVQISNYKNCLEVKWLKYDDMCVLSVQESKV